jgi:hypothetical protein
MRGGRGGRGGRGRGGRGSVTHDLLKDNLEDMGIDLYSYRGSSCPDPLFPHITLKPCTSLTSDDLYLVQKARELTHR